MRLFWSMLFYQKLLFICKKSDYYISSQHRMQEAEANPRPQGDIHHSAYTFSLKKMRQAESPIIMVDFEPEQCGGNSQVDDSAPPSFYKSFPVFNDDGMYFTPSFMLHYDKLRTPNNLQAFLQLHQNRVQEIVQQRQQLFVPKPTKNNSFCCVCKTFFQDYLEHVTLQKHQEQLQGSKFRKDILQLCQRFTTSTENPRENAKTKRIRKPRANSGKAPKSLFRSASVETEISPLIEAQI